MKKSRSKILSEVYGGNWKYNFRHRCFECDDGKRRVTLTATCTCDDWCDHPSEYIMYGVEPYPKRVPELGSRYLEDFI